MKCYREGGCGPHEMLSCNECSWSRVPKVNSDKQSFEQMLNVFMKNLPTEFCDWLVGQGFFTAPASTKYHGVYEGGLFEHSKNVTYCLVDFTNKLKLKWQRPESPYIIGMFHDLCKVDQYIKTEEDGVVKYVYNTEVDLEGHGDKSVMLLSKFMTLTEEEMLCIRYHMGAYVTDDWKTFGKAITKYPNVLFAHTADNYASKVIESD